MGHRPCAACCKGVVNGPFAVINADDFYGRTAFDFLAAQTDESCYADSNEMPQHKTDKTGNCTNL